MTRARRETAWVYEGVWGILSRWLLVPRTPPTLPTPEGGAVEAFHPGPGYLSYLLLGYWLGQVVWLVLVAGAAIFLTVAEPLLGLLALPVAVLLIVAPAVAAYVAIYLRYDTTWYVMNDRSLRIRNGLWIIHEMTFSYENVQNVSVSQGPVQRYFGIADVVVETAGGGAVKPEQALTQPLHTGRLMGLNNAQEVRDLILTRLKASRAAGLGDEDKHAGAPGWTAAHVALLREIRDAARGLGG